MSAIDRTTLPGSLMFALAKHYAAQDDMNPGWASVEFRPKPLELRATDGAQAVIASISTEIQEITSTVLIPIAAITTIKSCVKQGDDVELQYTRRSRQWALAYPPRGVTVAFTPTNSTFPDIEKGFTDRAPDGHVSYAYIDTAYLKNLAALNFGEDCSSYVKVRIGGANDLVNVACRYVDRKATVRVGVMPMLVLNHGSVESEGERREVT